MPSVGTKQYEPNPSATAALEDRNGAKTVVEAELGEPLELLRARSPARAPVRLASWVDAIPTPSAPTWTSPVSPCLSLDRPRRRSVPSEPEVQVSA